ncbi:MAG: hypothetical protein JWP17_4102 [Solirubrobacterales bacterium]|nr:hypothetical protein [Solirubrobacterales bacterium]
MRGKLCLLVAVIAVLAVVPASASAKPKLGISDQNVSMFSDPLFHPLGISYVRYVTPWDVALKPESLSALALNAWLTAAAAQGDHPMVAFEHSAGDGCPRSPCTLPDPASYRAAMVAFRAKYPQVKTLSAWNEANNSTQPTYRKPIDAAQYYIVLSSVCPRCTIVAADVLDNRIMAKWLKTFSEAAPEARLWGLHNWSDTNRFKTDGTQAMLDAVKGDVWLTETGGIVAFQTIDGRQTFHPSDARAAKAVTFLFDKIVPISRRIKRVYVYNWLSAPTNRWDSGLIDHGGHARRMYDVVKRYAAR